MPADPRTVLDATPPIHPNASPASSTEPRPYRFSLDDAYAIRETGVFREKRVELIGGQFLVKEPPSSFHSGMVNRLLHQLQRIVGTDAILSAQNPVVLSQHDAPEPDIAILAPRDDFYTSEHPGPEDVFLVIEVANTSFGFDQSTKASLYAAAGIGTYWIVDVKGQTVRVHTNPRGETYDGVRIHTRADTLPLPVPDAPQLSVSELFPEPEQDAENVS